MKLLSLVNRPWKLAIIALVALVVYVPSSYIVPDTYYVEVIGTEVKRTGKTKGTDEYRVRVKFVNADDTLGGVYVSRNEDNWWYLKYKSADIQAEFDSLSRCPGNRVYVRYMGWRWQLISMFPNVVSIVEVSNPGVCGSAAR